MASFFVLCFFLCFSSLLILSSSSSITLNLKPIHSPKEFSNQQDYISHIAKSTLTRAHHLKNPKHNPASLLKKTEQTPLYPRSYGGYSVSLAFGTPPQVVPFVFDTGSSLVWSPCTDGYSCINCNFAGVDPNNIATFKPKNSSTTRIVGCHNPKCAWIFGSDVEAQCGPACGPNSPANCTQPRCPGYLLQYGLGATTGVLIIDNLDFPDGQIVPEFLFGCSLLSANQPEGIAGFGRAKSSLPTQLKLKSFSHCLLSHTFNDEPKSSNLTLAGKSAGKVAGVQYTPFRASPNKPPYEEYYYVSLRKITVGGKNVKVPSEYLVPDVNGTGGVIVDSGTTLTYLERALYNPLVAAFVAQTGHLKRAHDVEAQSPFGLCYDISSIKDDDNFAFPELVYHFKGGATMVQPLANYFSFVGDENTLCLTVVTDSSPAGPTIPIGPAMILGNYQQQNFHIEYDLEHQKFGFKHQKCG